MHKGRKTKFLVIILIAVVSFISIHIAWANNLEIKNVSLEGRYPAAGTMVVEFDISWDNSWRDGTNHDAAWVFLKIRDVSANNVWESGPLKSSGYNPADTSAGSNKNMDIFVPADKAGAFLRRKSNGSGTFLSNNVRLTLDYSKSEYAPGSTNIASTDVIEVNVYGMEMVYIPQGDFYVCDGGSSSCIGSSGCGAELITSAFKGMTAPASEEQVYYANNAGFDDDGVLDGGGGTGIGIDGNGGIDTDNDGNIDNALFPTGWEAFYFMKYELSQGQYVDFLNSLQEETAQNARVEADLTDDDEEFIFVMVSESASGAASRNAISAGLEEPGGEPHIFGCDLNANHVLDRYNDGQWIAMNYLNWMDLAAYADWAGLRPMTELEFEKAARGPLNAIYSKVVGEYAWGNTEITDCVKSGESIVHSGEAIEAGARTGDGLANYDSDASDFPYGPMRVGFAAASATTRSQAGAGYYGNMNLSDNVMEMVVSLGIAAGRSFEGTHGDGVLVTGNATNNDWPGIDGTTSKGITSAAGSGLRGGAWDYANTLASISDRTYSAYGTRNSTRERHVGGRLTRTANLLPTVIYVTAVEAPSGDFDDGDGARIGADAYCVAKANRPNNLPIDCTNIHAFISVSSTDEIQDMPTLYGYHPEAPVYWWNNTTQVFTKLQESWDEMLDGTDILASAETGTGTATHEFWTGSTSAGALAGDHCTNWTDGTGGSNGEYGGYLYVENGWWLDYQGMEPCDSNYLGLYCACQYPVYDTVDKKTR